MFSKHPSLHLPNEDEKLWRYMDFTKFFSILENSSIHLAPLTSFEDPFEGLPTKKLIDKLRLGGIGYVNEHREISRIPYDRIMPLLKSSRDNIYASCWHMNENESAGMWSQYIKLGDGIAIQTTLKRIKLALTSDSIDVTGGLISYVNFDTYNLSDLNSLTWSTLKRESFEHEREFRLLYISGEIDNSGFHAKINIETMIEAIYLSPTIPKWIEDLIKKMILRYNISSSIVMKSKILESPDYF